MFTYNCNSSVTKHAEDYQLANVNLPQNTRKL